MELGKGKEKALLIVNVVLGLTALFLLLNLLGVKMITTGQASYWLDQANPVCIASFEEHKSLISMDLCCQELQNQLRCEAWKWSEPVLVGGETFKMDRRCYTGKGAVEYFVNMKAYSYCKKEGFLR